MSRSLPALLLWAALAVPDASAQSRRSNGTQRANPVTFESDRATYAPGTTAVFNGSGFIANEVVTLRVLHADGTPAPGPEHDAWTVLASGSGRFVSTWTVCDHDYCVGLQLVALADGSSSGAHGETSFSNNHDCGTGVVTAVTPVGSSCSDFTPAVGNGPDNYEVEEGGTYVMTIEGVTECTGDTITVFVQSSASGNFCFDAVGGGGTYVGTFTVPSPTCHTMPVSYKCGAGAACSHAGSFAASGPTSGCGGVHLRASEFDGSCSRTGEDEDCGAPGPTGACCLVDGTCVEVEADECFAMGGAYQGDDTLCADTMCDAPTGACCLDDGSCAQVTAEECALQGGTYYGDFSMCKDVACEQPPGACCLVDGSCIEVTEEECAMQGGTYHGDFSLCMDVFCEQPPGACCLADATCVEVTEEECTLQGGSYYGDFSSCVETTCPRPPGACCLDGTCVQLTEDECAAMGGLYSGDGTPCPDGSGCSIVPCYVLDFELDDEGNPMAHGTKVDTEYDGGPSFPVTITGSVNFSGQNTVAILNSSTGPAMQDPDLLVGRGNLLILQNEANLNFCGAGIYCSHNDDEDGGLFSLVFDVPAIPSSLTLVDIDATDGTSSVVLTDSSARTRTFSIPANWTGDFVTNGPPGYKALNLSTLANQPGFASVATATEQAGFDPAAVVRIDVVLNGSGAIDDLEWCQ